MVKHQTPRDSTVYPILIRFTFLKKAIYILWVGIIPYPYLIETHVNTMPGELKL
jgi:hypothetical protein